MLTNEIATFAARHAVPVTHAHTLPAIFGKCADLTGRHVRSLVSEATYSNQNLADYICEVAAKVAARVPAEGSQRELLI